MKRYSGLNLSFDTFVSELPTTIKRSIWHPRVDVVTYRRFYRFRICVTTAETFFVKVSMCCGIIWNPNWWWTIVVVRNDSSLRFPLTYLVFVLFWYVFQFLRIISRDFPSSRGRDCTHWYMNAYWKNSYLPPYLPQKSSICRTAEQLY